MEWLSTLVSAHRPLVFGCRAAQAKEEERRFIDPKCIHRPALEAPRLVAARVEREQGRALLKRAIQQVSRAIQQEHRIAPPQHSQGNGPNDLAILMEFLRAV